MSEPSLKTFFKDDWYKFTCDVMDDVMVSAILGNEIAPDNHAHTSKPDTFVSACAGFMEENGEQFALALDHLKTRRA